MSCNVTFLLFQFTVFRHLYRFWEKFCTFRGNHAEEKILPTIERIRKHERAKQRAEQQRQDELALKVRVVTCVFCVGVCV